MSDTRIERVANAICPFLTRAWYSPVRREHVARVALAAADAVAWRPTEAAADIVSALAERWQQQADVAEDEGDRAGVEVMTEAASATRECAAAIRALKEPPR